MIRQNKSVGPKSLKYLKELFEVESLGFGTKIGMYGAGLGQLTPVIIKQEGITLIDIDGKEYLDFGGAVASASLGFRPKVVIDAMMKQSETVAHCPDFPTIPRIELAKELVALAPGDLKNNSRVMFDVGGGPMIDLAVRLAYFYNMAIKKRTRNAILTFYGAYHGRTVMGSLLTGYSNFIDMIPYGQEIVRTPYPYCYRCYFDKEYPSCDLYCAKYIKKMFEYPHTGWRNSETNNTMVTTCVVEPIQCHGGGIFPPAEFYGELRKICDEYEVVMIEDSIPTYTFSGQWFCCEYYDTTPDMVVLAKSLTGGMWPLGAIIARKDLYRIWDDLPDRHYTSYMANPLGCAAALATIKTIKEKNLLEHVREVGVYFLEGLKELQRKYQVIGEVNGRGLILSMEFVRNRVTKVPAVELSSAVVREALKRGLILLGGLGPFGNRYIIHPPLIVTYEQIDNALKIMDESIRKVEKMA